MTFIARRISNSKNICVITRGNNMAKSVSKSDTVKLINSVETLDIKIEVIDRDETTPSKMTKINRFIAELNKHVKDERDVVMVSVKVR
jgi:hypothetical protein